MNRNLALEVVRVTEAAALAASQEMGRGDEKAADQAAVDAMRRAFDSLEIERGEDLLKAREDLFFHPLKKEVSSFSLGLKDKTLQIRVKPMNKFTVSALKVNCSVKTERSN